MISGVGKKRFQHLATKKTTIFVFFLNLMEFFTLFGVHAGMFNK